LILDSAEYEDFAMEAEEDAVGTVEQQAVPGQMQDPTAQPAAEEKEAPPEEKEKKVPPEETRPQPQS